MQPERDANYPKILFKEKSVANVQEAVSVLLQDGLTSRFHPSWSAQASGATLLQPDLFDLYSWKKKKNDWSSDLVASFTPTQVSDLYTPLSLLLFPRLPQKVPNPAFLTKVGVLLRHRFAVYLCPFSFTDTLLNEPLGPPVSPPLSCRLCPKSLQTINTDNGLWRNCN